MTARSRLVVFDVDGTLVDSQAVIVASMGDAFAAEGMVPPSRSDILGIVGLSLPKAMMRLTPDGPIERMVQSYKDSFVARRAAEGSAQSSPLYPGARVMLERLQTMPDIALGIATGKSRRGLDLLIEAHGLEGMFVTQQVADYHPSKPHPAMLHAALDETFVEAGDAVMIGDTTYDMQMAEAAGIPFIGVSWGYHPVSHLTGAATVLTEFSELDAALNDLWGSAT